MKKIEIIVLICITIILSGCGNSKKGTEDLENMQNDNSLIQESDTLILANEENITETIEENVNYLEQENVSLSQDKEESEDVNFAMEDEKESQKSTTENPEKTENFNTNNTLSSTVQNDITKIIVTNGSTGEKREIDAVEEIDNLLEQIKELKIISQEEKNVQGYSYSLALYKDENLTQIVYVNKSTIVIDGTVYTVESSQNIIDSVK